MNRKNAEREADETQRFQIIARVPVTPREELIEEFMKIKNKRKMEGKSVG